MISDLSELFGATIQHQPATGFNANGEPSFGPATPYPARVLYRAQQILGANGERTVARGAVWIAGTPFVGLDDVITLPDGSKPPIIAAELLTDESGPSHAHIYFS